MTLTRNKNLHRGQVYITYRQIIRRKKVESHFLNNSDNTQLEKFNGHIIYVVKS